MQKESALFPSHLLFCPLTEQPLTQHIGAAPTFVTGAIQISAARIKYLLLLSHGMKKILSVLSKKKYTEQPKQKWEEADSSLSSFNSMSSNSEHNGLRRSPCTSEDQIRRRSKSPGVGSKIKRVHPVSSSDTGEITFTASQPKGIIRSGVTCILEAHVPRMNVEGESTIAALSARSDEMNRDHTRVPPGRLSAVTSTHSNATQDRGSSEASSSHQRRESASTHSPPEASSPSKQFGRLAPRNSPNKIVQTEPVDDSILRPLSKGLNVAFGDTNPARPPPPNCSQCNEHYSDKPSRLRISSNKLKVVTHCYNSVYDFDEQLFKGSLAGRPVYVARRVSEKSNFCSEVEILKNLQHPNIVTLRGFCDEDDSQALVFNFVCCNRDLLYNLSSKGLKRETMPWPHRAKLAVELARGLEYLHKSGIIHGNVNSKNVFVTHDFVPVIGDFSLSSRVQYVRDLILQDRQEDKKARGYLAPDYLLGEKHSEKQDVYAFGVILLELISGRAPFDRNNRPDCYLDKWSRKTIKEFEPSDQAKLLETMADPRLNSDFCKYEMLGMISVAKLCTREDSKKRPDMKEVLTMLLTGHITDHIARSKEKPAAKSDQVARSQEKPATKSEPPLSPQRGNSCFGSRSISPVMQQPILQMTLNPLKLLPTFFREAAVPPQPGHRDQSSMPSTSTTADSGSNPNSEKRRFKGHPDRERRKCRNPRPARPRVMDGSTPANAKPSPVSPRRSVHGRRPATPGHRLSSRCKLGAPQSPGFPMKARLLWYNPKNPGAPRMTKEKQRVRFAERRRSRWNL